MSNSAVLISYIDCLYLTYFFFANCGKLLLKFSCLFIKIVIANVVCGITELLDMSAVHHLSNF